MNPKEALPEVTSEPSVLVRLSNAHKGLKEAVETQEREAKAAYWKAMDSHASYVARCQSAVFSLVAEAHDEGFSPEQINRQIY